MGRGKGILAVIDPGLDERDEGPLVERARSLDVEAWRALHDRHRPLVLGFLRKLGADEDELQETFLRAYRSIATFEAGRPFGAWLITIARNLVIDARRREKGKPVPTDPRRLEDET